MIRAFRIALSFFTVIPVGSIEGFRREELSQATAWLPLVGALVGAVLVVVGLLAGAMLPVPLAAALVLAAWLTMTGMLHLDGLLDAADALLAPVVVERRLQILADVHMGAFAFGVGAMTLLLKWQALAATTPSVAWIAAPVGARVAAVWALRWYPPARGDGLGASAAQVDPRLALVALVVILFAAPGVAVATVTAGAAFAAWAARRLGDALTGDLLGALIELAELAGLLAAAIVEAR